MTQFKGVMSQKPAKPRPFWPRQTYIWAPLSWVPITRMSLGLRSQVNMGTEEQGYGDWTNTHDNDAIGRAFFPKHASVQSSAMRRK